MHLHNFTTCDIMRKKEGTDRESIFGWTYQGVARRIEG